MMREEGLVIALDGEYALVSGQRQKACGTCSNLNTCTVLSGGLGQRSIKLRARNACHAQVGERVFIEISEKSFLKASFLVYILPLVVLFAVVSWSRYLVQTFEWKIDIEAVSAIVGFISLALTFYWLRQRSKRLEQGDQEGGPVIVEVLSSNMCHSTPPSFLS
ncbi:MAG: SoxR reducing system RseC family protein [Magnetococcales bacterium]|nr:SoxR reducing system RseC family protein [Magnetococcales bacterium]